MRAELELAAGLVGAFVVGITVGFIIRGHLARAALLVVSLAVLLTMIVASGLWRQLVDGAAL